MLDANESRPAGNGAAIKINVDARSAPSIDDLPEVLLRADHALLVTRRIKGGKVRHRLMLSLAAAERAVELARKAGQPATITLVKLQPVGLVDLAELEVSNLDGIGGESR